MVSWKSFWDTQSTCSPGAMTSSKWDTCKSNCDKWMCSTMNIKITSYIYNAWSHTTLSYLILSHHQTVAKQSSIWLQRLVAKVVKSVKLIAASIRGCVKYILSRTWDTERVNPQQLHIYNRRSSRSGALAIAVVTVIWNPHIRIYKSVYRVRLN